MSRTKIVLLIVVALLVGIVIGGAITDSIKKETTTFIRTVERKASFV